MIKLFYEYTFTDYYHNLFVTLVRCSWSQDVQNNSIKVTVNHSAYKSNQAEVKFIVFW